MRSYTRFIPGEEIDVVAKWRFGDMDAASMFSADQTAGRGPVEQAEYLRQQGYAEGFAQGRAQAVLDTQQQVNAFISAQGQEAGRQFETLLTSARAQLDAAENEAAQGVLDLACELARQVLRHEIATDPNTLMPVIRESLGLLFSDAKGVQVRLNPLDLEVLQDVLREESANASMTLLADPSITKGGCLVESGGTVVDGKLEKRWSRAIGQLGRNLPWEVPGDAQ